MVLSHYFPVLVLVALLAAALPVRGEEATAGADFEHWTAELGSEQFQVRQNASRRLLEAGPAAVPAIAKAIQRGDAEIRRRAVQALVEQSLSPRQEQRQPARDALAALESSDDAPVAHAARGALDKLRSVTVNLAAAELTRLGATVMPQSNSYPATYAVQIRQSWTGGDQGLALLADLGAVTWLSVENAPVTDACLPHIARLTTLQNLYLGSSRLSGQGLAQLAPLSSLRYLSLKQLPIVDRHLAELPDFPQLQQLGLDHTQITDAGLAHVARYRNVHTLWLDHTRVTDAGLYRLQPLAALRTLYLAGTEASGPGLGHLKDLPALRSISLKDARLSADSLRHLGHATQLESLGLDNTNVTDAQIDDLTSLSQLRILWLNQTAVTDAGVKKLKGLKRLQIVYLTGTKTTKEAIAELKQALPQSQISR